MDSLAEKRILDTEKLEKVAFILKTIAHPLRIGIVDLLTTYERLSVNEICFRLDAEQSLTSHHLSNMKLKGILGSEREGKNIFYFLKLKEVTKVIDCMENCDIANF
ncbi:MAG TPA: transcriptional regulator [Cytophagales bacterium]|nr:transcriptional regulator [Cytophagales bacterium]HAA17594.1 transcriptional regulator [Cytophagales bacterium]HAP61662.1 transcriptional regulator [Cytophagales bacterium]